MSGVRRGDLGAAFLVVCAAGGALGMAAPACAETGDSVWGEVEALPADGNVHAIGEVVIEYFAVHPDHPAVEEVLGAEVRLTRSAGGWVQPLPGERVERFTLGEIPGLAEQRFYDSALTLLIQAVSERLTSLDLLGTYAEADPGQFEIVGGLIEDRREEGDLTLRIGVTTGVVAQVRTSALGERFASREGEGDLIDLQEHERVLRQSPVVVSGDEASREQLPLLRRKEISDYAYRLSRHPGRRADISVAPSALEPGAVTLDYLVTENKPWVMYAQLSNTGTDATNELQERFGFIHNQLSGADDVFSIEYATNSFEGTNSVIGSYERPLGFGGRLRGRVYSAYYDYDASAVGQAGADFEGDGWSIGAEAIANVLQFGDSFIDVVGGLRYDDLEVVNELADLVGEDNFLVGYGGVRYERALGVNRTFADVTFEGSFDGLDGDSDNTLGRTEADEDWALMRVGFSQSIFLETLFAPSLADSGSLAHEVVLSGRGQWAFDNRLVPNFQQVAGGLYTVRGYEQSIVAGDNLLLGSAEYRFHVPRSFSPDPEPVELFGEPFRVSPQYRTGPTDWDFIVRGFIDVARVTQSDVLPFEDNTTLVGAGFGVELAVRRNLTARVDFAWAIEEVDDALGQTIVDTGDNEIHFVVTVVY